jgi:hypothetical protein
VQLSPELVGDGQVLRPQLVRDELLGLFSKLDVRPSEIRLVVSDRVCVTRVLDYPKMPHPEFEKSIPFEAERELPMDVEEAYLAWEVLETNEQGQTVLLVGGWREAVDSYVEALRGVAPVKVVEPRSFALARAAGLTDAVLADWTGDQLQLVVVVGRRVTFTTTAVLLPSVTDSPMRLAQVFCTLLPKPSIRRNALPRRIVFLGQLHGRDDVAAFVQRQPLPQSFDMVTDWIPPGEFGELSAIGQVATAGLLIRRQRSNVEKAQFPELNLLPKPRIVRQSQPIIRPQFVVALVMSLALFGAVVFGQLVPTLASK